MAKVIEVDGDELHASSAGGLQALLARGISTQLGAGGDDGLLSSLQAVRDAGHLLVLLHLENLEPRETAKMLGVIRGAIEDANPSHSIRGLRLVLVGRDELAMSAEPYSAIQGVVATCRLPRLTEGEVQRLLQTAGLAPADAPTVTSLARQLHRVAGGQPLLTRRLITTLEDRVRTGSAPDCRAAYRALRDRPPEEQLRAWRRRLARMVQRDPDIRAFATDLTRGKEYRLLDAPAATRALSIAGWLSPGSAEADGSAVWRFSDLHRHWAEAVMRNPQSHLGGTAP